MPLTLIHDYAGARKLDGGLRSTACHPGDRGGGQQQMSDEMFHGGNHTVGTMACRYAVVSRQKGTGRTDSSGPLGQRQWNYEYVTSNTARALAGPAVTVLLIAS
ncbi:hypothetical protein BPNSA17_11510 [Bordetella petrii]